MKKEISVCLFLIALMTTFGCESDTSGNSGLPLNAQAGQNRIVMSKTDVTLDGSSSTGDITSYAWTQVSGAPVTLSSSSARQTGFTSPGLAPGTSEDLVFSLTVSDASGTSTASVTVTVLTWKQVDTGVRHSIALRSDGTLWAWGSNCSGQIGQGDSGCPTYQDLITQVGTGSDWTAVAAGDGYNLALKQDGSVWSWGDNTNGQLGNGSTGTDVTVPAQIPGLSGIVAISARDEQSYAVDSSGNLYAWGYHNLDRLGLGSSSSAVVTQPTQVTGISSVTGISTGGISTLAFDGSGTFYGWGNNAYGQLGIPDNVGTGGYGSVDLPDAATGISDIVAVASGGQHSYILRDVAGNGTRSLWSMGYNFNGELGTGDAATENATITEITVAGISGWKDVAAGGNQGLAIAGDGTLWAWGYNNDGQLGIGTSGVGTGPDVPQQVGSDTDWYSVSAWLNHSAALKSDGTLWLWGRSGYGALGDSTLSDTTVPNRVGF